MKYREIMQHIAALLVTCTRRSGFILSFYWGGLALSMIPFRVSCNSVGSFSELFLLGLYLFSDKKMTVNFFNPKLFYEHVVPLTKRVAEKGVLTQLSITGQKMRKRDCKQSKQCLRTQPCI